MQGKSNIVIVGFGWVGQANAIAFLQDGNAVSYFDVAKDPVLHYKDAWTSAYEKIPRLASAQELDAPETTYLVCVGDRFDVSAGAQNIEPIAAALEQLRGVKGTVILRSTIVAQSLKNLPFDIYMPEFLHEKYAIEECCEPALLILGIRGTKPVPDFIERLVPQAGKVYRGTPEEASYIKYLSNIWGALRIAFTNEYGDAMHAGGMTQKQIEGVLHVVLESRAYQKYGKAFGGHCLPKDLQAFIAEHPETPLLKGVWTSNERHKILEDRSELSEIFSKWE